MYLKISPKVVLYMVGIPATSFHIIFLRIPRKANPSALNGLAWEVITH